MKDIKRQKEYRGRKEHDTFTSGNCTSRYYRERGVKWEEKWKRTEMVIPVRRSDRFVQRTQHAGRHLFEHTFGRFNTVVISQSTDVAGKLSPSALQVDLFSQCIHASEIIVSSHACTNPKSETGSNKSSCSKLATSTTELPRIRIEISREKEFDGG